MVFSIFTELCTHLYYLIPGNFHHSKRNLIPLSCHSLTTPRALSNHESTFCLCKFAYSKHFPYMESYNMWPFVPDFFHTWYFSMFIHLCRSIYQCFIPFYGQETFHCMDILPFVCPFINSWAFGPLPLLGYDAWCCCEHLCTSFYMEVPFHFSIHRVGIAGSYGMSVFSILRNCRTIFQSG